MGPVSSNVASKTCDNPISSNCVIVPIQIPGTNSCKGEASLTSILYDVANNSACCDGSFPAGHQSCHTGSWVDFSTSISPSGVGGTYSYTTGSFGFAGFGNPSYMWTKTGDLKLRGRFMIDITKIGTFVGNNFFRVPMITLPTSCLPTGGIYNQVSNSTIAHNFDNLQDPIFAHGGPALDIATGVLYFDVLFEKRAPGLIQLDCNLGAITFNLA